MNKLITPKQFVKDLIATEAKACKSNNLPKGSLLNAMAKAYNKRLDKEAK